MLGETFIVACNGGNQHVVDVGVLVREVKVVKALRTGLELDNPGGRVDLKNAIPIGAVVGDPVRFGHSVK